MNKQSLSEPVSPFYTLSVEETVRFLNTDLLSGLTVEEVSRRQKIFGFNQIRKEKGQSLFKIFLDQVFNPMILLLLAVVGISLAIQHWMDALIIAVIVLLNTGIGFFQEYRAEKAMQSIRRLTVPKARVLREGRVTSLAAKDLVPGDIVLLEAGDRIPADLRWSEVVQLQIDESLLTGESLPVFKESKSLHADELALGNRHNLGFMGTYVVGGRAIGICIRTGSSTELGHIAHLVSQGKAGELPLKKRVSQLTRRLVLLAFALCLLIFAIGLLQKKAMLEMLLAAISLGVAAIPEGLPAVITISLSLGALRLARRGVLVRRLQAVEALGAITTICADKTGTLTLNRMEVKTVYLNAKRQDVLGTSSQFSSESPYFFWALSLCNDAEIASEGQSSSGDPMEVALLRFVDVSGYHSASLREIWNRQSEIPFDADRKRMTVVCEKGGEYLVFMKGAPENVLPLCSEEETVEGNSKILESRRQELEAIQQKMASEGYRVLAVAMKRISFPFDGKHLEEKMSLLGFVGLKDPPRPEAKEAIANCRSAGIRPVMITGDHPATALAIGRELGLCRDGDGVITGSDLKREGRALLDERALHTSIYARVSPEDKLKIIEVLQDTHQIVAMTGDGVNDAPALKRADVGIAMGRGTDVAKEASALILTEENFATIVRAIGEGRVIYDNIRKFIRYMLTTNLGEIVTMLLAMVLGLALPLVPVQILWINLVTDGLPAVALGFEPAEGNVMSRPPRSTQESIFSRGLWQHTVWVAMLMGGLTISSMYFSWSQYFDLKLARTMTFTTLVFAQMGHVMGIRSASQGLWKIGLFSNYRLLVAVLLTIFSQILIVYISPLQNIFGTSPLSLQDLAICFLLGLIIYAAVELEKFLRRRLRVAS